MAHINLRRLLRPLFMLTCLAWLFLMSSGNVLAAANFVRSIPGNGKSIASVPPSVSIEVSERLQADSPDNHLFVYGPDGKLVSSEMAHVSTDNPKILQVAINNEGPGTYIVQWNTVSAVDGKSAQGAFTFTVNPAVASSQDQQDQNNIPLLALLITGIVTLLLGFVLGSGWSRNRDATAPHIIDPDEQDSDQKPVQFTKRSS